MLTQREMDEIKIMAEAKVQAWWEEFERLYMGGYDFERLPDEEIAPLLGLEVENDEPEKP